MKMATRNNDIDFMTPDILKQLMQWIEEDNLVKFYQSKDWRKVRKLILGRDRRTCQTCFKKGNTVHHKRTVKEFPQEALVVSNLETICYKCHNREHPEKLAKYNERPFVNEERW